MARGRSIVDVLPIEILVTIVILVSKSPVSDVMIAYRNVLNLKHSCRQFKELCDGENVYHNLHQGYFPKRNETPKSTRQIEIERRCRIHGNPNLYYRQAMVDYFVHKKIFSAYYQLSRAVDGGHKLAKYVACFFMLINQDSKIREEGSGLLYKWKTTKNKKDWVCENRLKCLFHIRKLDVKPSYFKNIQIMCDKGHVKEYDAEVFCLNDAYKVEPKITCKECMADFEVYCLTDKFGKHFTIQAVRNHISVLEV